MARFDMIWGQVDLKSGVRMGRLKKGMRGLARNNERGMKRMGTNNKRGRGKGTMRLIDLGGWSCCCG